MLGIEEIERRFGSTAKSPAGTAGAHAELRMRFVNLALALDLLLPDEPREKWIAFDLLETASMWAHKSCAQIELAPEAPEPSHAAEEEEDLEEPEGHTPKWVQNIELKWGDEKGTSTNNL